jgi:diacylglycerol kinase family enzyme
MAPNLTSVPTTRPTHISHGPVRTAEKVAVLLNANARHVTEGVRREIARFVPAQDVFLSRSFDDARQIVSTVLEQGYSTLLVGGGDGTFVGYVNEIFAQIDEHQVSYLSEGSSARKVLTRKRPLRFGVLHLGTGNAVAGHVGSAASQVGMIEDILRARAGDVKATKQLHLIQVDGKVAPFAGLGADARILGDYTRLKNAFLGTPLGGLASGVSGYVFSAVGITAPALLMEGKAPNVEVVNEGSPVQQLGPDGRPVGKPIANGEIIYRGPCRLAAAGTVPSYGFGFTIFPHVQRIPGRIQLRLTAMSSLEMVRHMPALWKGRTPTASILDFSVDKVRLSFDRKMPFQVGGDATSDRDQVSLELDSRTVDLLDFKASA